MNLRIKTKNHATDSKIGSPLQIDFRADWTHESIPTAWELIYSIGLNSKSEEKGRLCLFMGAPIKFDFFKLEKYFRPGAKF